MLDGSNLLDIAPRTAATAVASSVRFEAVMRPLWARPISPWSTRRHLGAPTSYWATLQHRWRPRTLGGATTVGLCSSLFGVLCCAAGMSCLGSVLLGVGLPSGREDV